MAETYKKILKDNSKVQVESAIRDGEGVKISTNYAKKSEIPDVSNFITKSVDDLTNYTLSTGVGTTIDLSINSSTYVVTLSLKNSSGTVLSTDTIDLPLESVVVSGSYDDTTKKIVLTLQSGSTVEFSVADLVSGLQSEITSNNKLSSDLVDDTNNTNKFVTTSEKSTWNGKQDAITSSNKLSADNVADGTTNKVYTGTEQTKLSGIESGAEVNDVTDVQIGGTSILSSKVANIVTNSTYNASSNKIATMSDLPTKVSDLTNDSGFITSETNQKVKTSSVTFGDNDVVEIKAGSNVTVTGDATNKTITIGATDTTYNTINNDYNASTNKLATANDLPPTITITTTSGSESVSDGTNTLNFGANAFTNTTIPTSYVSSVNGDTGAITNVVKTTDLGTVATLNTGTSSGNVPVLDSNGKLASSILPAIAITDTFVVNSQASMLALTAQVGDVAVRTDLNKSFILKTDGASTLANWQELLTPTDAVTSVNGQTGAVTLSIPSSASDVNALPSSTKYGKSLSVSGTSVSLKDQDGTVLSTVTTQDTTYESKSASSGGTAVSLVTTGEKYTWNNKSNFSGSYNDLSDKPTIPSAVTSINGLSGGKLTSPLQISGGDSTTASKIALDQTASGQITNNATQTIFGFTSNNATNLTVGHSSYGLKLRGSGTRPQFNSNDLALYSDIPTNVSIFTNDAGYTTNTGTITGVQLNGSTIASSGVANIQALPNYSLSIGSTNGGNPRQVLFCSVNYTNFDSNSGAYFKLGAMSGHGNGSSYTFVEDIFINVNYQGTVTCNVYKYVQQSVTLENVDRNYGDIFWTIDTTNKIVYFYILLGQYSSAQFTPGTKIGASKAVTSANGIVQYTGTPTYYSSGTKVWATGNSTTYAKLSDIPTNYATVQVYNSEADALSASQQDPNKICLY